MTAQSLPSAGPSPSLPSIIGPAVTPRGLKLRPDLTVPGWMFWELRTLNRHRVVGFLKAHRAFANAQELNEEIRGVLSHEFNRAWWRGIAYGVVVDVASISIQPDDLKTLVDVRENDKGDVQWVVLVSTASRVALGVHTWIEAYLSPAYRAILLSLESAKYSVSSVKREKDGLMKFLTGVANFEAAIHSFGTRVAFPEFKNITADAPAASTMPGDGTPKPDLQRS